MLPPDSEDPLNRGLREWEIPDPPADLESRVWQRVAARSEAAPGARFHPWSFRLAAASLAVAAAAVAVVWIGEQRLEKVEELHMAQDYRGLLNPDEAGAEAGLSAEARLDRDLLWLQRELQLDAGQFAQLKSLHEESSERLQLLAGELAQARSTEAHWETERKSSGTVDFLSYAVAAQGASHLNAMLAQTSRSLVASAEAVLNDEQRERYLHLLRPMGSRGEGAGP